MIPFALVDILHAQIRSSRDTADRARTLLARTRERLMARTRAAGRFAAGTGRPIGRLTHGNEPLEGAALVAFTRCGHWWVYPGTASAEHMHEVARFNLGIACSFCLAERHAATHARAGGMLTRGN